MEYKILLPQTIWEGYDAGAEPLESSLEYSFTRGSINVNNYRFTAITSGEDDKVRVAVTTYSSMKDTEKVILIVPEYHKTPSIRFIDDLASSGYLVVVPDISGVSEPQTTFGKKYSYGKFSEAGDHIKKVMPTARETNQYLYTLIIKRTIAFIRAGLSSEKLALVGLGDGVEVAMQVAGSNTPTIDALACLNGAGYREYIKLNKYGEGKELVMDEERMSWLSGVASVAYAKYITVPTLIALGTNSEKSDIDRVSNLIALLPDDNDNVATIFSPQAEDILLPKAYKTFKIWLSRILDGKNFPETPIVSIRVDAEGKIYIDSECDPSSMAANMTVYYSYGEYDHRIRSWYSAEGIAISHNEYITSIEVYKKDAPLFAFAEVEYENGITLTSVIDFMELKGQPVKEKPYKQSRVVYEGANGKYGFEVSCEREVMLEEGVRLVTIPNGTQGITTTFGCLKTYRFNASQITMDSLLQMDLYAEEELEVDITLQEKTSEGIKKYKTSFTLSNTEGFFQNFKFKVSDFKDDRLMPLTSWANIKSIAIRGKGVVVGNILFV